jgi:hypothetical protein
MATSFECEKLRCNCCGEIFTARPPHEGSEKYDATAGAMIALLKYGTGVPFNRLEQLQDVLGVPLPASTQWDSVETNADRAHPVYKELIRQVAQGEIVHVEGAPLDNNVCEQALKMAIMHRKNSLFYRSLHGAYIGDLFMSLIHTCRLAKANPLHYLVALQKHSSEVHKNPQRWLPWNYQAEALA